MHAAELGFFYFSGFVKPTKQLEILMQKSGV